MRVTIDQPLDKMALVGGQRLCEAPLVFRYQTGLEPMDLLPTTYAGVILISERFRDVLSQHAFSGWATFPVEVHGIYGESIDGYSGLVVTGRCARIDPSRAQIERRPAVSTRGRPFEMRVGMYFLDDRSDGTDIFSPAGTLHKIVVARVKDAIEKHLISNTKFRRLTKFECLHRVLTEEHGQ